MLRSKGSLSSYTHSTQLPFPADKVVQFTPMEIHIHIFLFLFLKMARGMILQSSHGMSKLTTSAHLQEKHVCIITKSDCSSA